jgi:hypothetical protein
MRFQSAVPQPHCPSVHNIAGGHITASDRSSETIGVESAGFAQTKIDSAAGKLKNGVPADSPFAPQPPFLPQGTRGRTGDLGTRETIFRR